MIKANLMKLAEYGVRQRLQEMQLELNALARDFPKIVCHADGTVPQVSALELKPGNGSASNGEYEPGKKRRGRAENLRMIVEFLQGNPNAPIRAISEHLGYQTPNSIRAYLETVARNTVKHVPGSTQSSRWVLKKGVHAD